MKYAVVIERTGTGYSAYVPDLPGRVAASRTAMGVRRFMREAIDFHLEGMRDDGLAPPKPSATTMSIDPPPPTRVNRHG